ncbi:hypothetical protein G4B88_008451 [Cannabis sativa]|uniref:Uncharacterized protein n=1 Tax=Cannabis sativa TaxID=3483 RepID=A0A7J6E9D5_CANSA|nr:hypothetical protein G4B88_008451 [Cannabis sativa]
MVARVGNLYGGGGTAESELRGFFFQRKSVAALVQKLIGHSPREVMAALASPDTGIGKMLIEMHDHLEHSVAVEMNVGCPESDALLLLRRVKSSFSSPQTRSLPVDPIDLSP